MPTRHCVQSFSQMHFTANRIQGLGSAHKGSAIIPVIIRIIMRALKSEFVFILLTMRLMWRKVSEEPPRPLFFFFFFLQATGVSREEPLHR